MKILFISPYLPSETSGHAGAQLFYRNISTLAKNHEITLASFIDSDERSMTTDLISKGIDVHTILYLRNQKSIIGKISSGIRNSVAIFNYLKGKEPFFFAKYKRKNMENLISTLVNQNRFDLVQVEYNVMHHYTKQIKNIPSVIVFYDISAKVHERGMISGDSTNKKSFEIAKKLEPKIGNKFDAVITVTFEDKLYLTNLGCKSEIKVIPPQIKMPNLGKQKKIPFSLCFLGSFNREPNVQAVQILIREIFPKLTKQAKLNIVGKGLSNSLINEINGTDRVNYLGFVEDIDSFLASQMIMVAPIKIGSGLKMKIPHALACGTAVITTDVGVEGISIDETNGLWEVGKVSEMAGLINELLPQSNLLIEKGLKGKYAVERLFSEEKIISQFEALYSDLVNS
ncbi:MAG: glycosyltransferase family 4 protein [Candidatus Marinimicrobia bacterium]|nr:glycosyltransferase family 4 protein [Candidatus Neomarinimicrobiota bacterium]MBT6938284.1 glycosyltransferase family 4 protein [Candidatus Neomarinimicrobiota bacterium]